MKKRKTILTQRVRVLQIIDRLVWVIPVLALLRLVISGLWENVIQECFADGTTFSEKLCVIIIVLFMTAMLSLPLMLIWRAVSRTLKKSAIKNTTFNVLQDLDYYRDKLTGVSPAAISMLTDLDIEPKKDITALILKYTLMGVVSTDGGSIKVLDFYHPSLTDSDKYLLSAIAANSLDPAIVARWKAMAKNEVMQSGYIVDSRNASNVQGKSCAASCSMGCITPIALMWVFYKLATSEWWTKLEEFEQALPENASNIEFVRTLLADSDSAISVLLLGIMTIMLFAAITLPIVGLIYLIVKLGGIKTVKRTDSGQELTEQIYGMKNFIHDFSELSQADKEQLVLWDDFLIYAVLLEENTSIINEIYSMKNIRPFNINGI